MGVVTALASDQRVPGAFNEFDSTSGSKGLIVSPRRLLLIGVWDGSGDGRATEATPIFVGDGELDADLLFGVGSELALMCRKALATWNKLGGAGELWACPILAPGAGTADTATYTVTGTATAGGDVVIRIMGHTISTGVASGDAASVVAVAMESAINAQLAKIMCVPTETGAVVTCTCNHKGVAGGEIVYELIKTVAGISVAVGAAVAGSGVADLSTGLDNSETRQYDAVALSNHLTQDSTDSKSRQDSAWGSDSLIYGHIFMGEAGAISAATTLASSTNYKNICVVGMEGAKNLDSELAAAVAAMSIYQERPNYNYDGTVLPLIAPDAGDVFTDTEQNTGLAGGVTPLHVNDAGEVYMVRLVTTKTTESSNPFENLLDLGHSKTQAFAARQVSAKVKLIQKGANLDDELLGDINSAVQDLLYEMQDLKWLHKVAEHMSELVVHKHPTVPSRSVASIPESVVPAAHQFVGKHVLHIE